VNAYDCERGSMHAGAREEAKAFDREIRSVHASAREEACMLLRDR
jgi:hypothetical protein